MKMRNPKIEPWGQAGVAGGKAASARDQATSAVQSRFGLACLLVALAVLSGCTALLPRGSSSTGAAFRSFDEARVAAERIVALKTQTSELGPLGFDIRDGLNVTLVSYPEIVVRLTPHPGVPISKLDAGIRQCIDIQMACRGYVFRFDREDRRREGNFWLDFFNVSRTTHLTGWRFEALIVVSDDTVLFRNYSGQARTEKTETQTNPLGPFQPAGEGAGASLLK